MGLSIRGIDVSLVFYLVSRTEKRLGMWNGSQRSVYRRIGPWLVQQQYLDSFLFRKWLGHPKVMIPDFFTNLSLKGVLRIIKARLVSEKLVSPTSAPVIRIKNNVRTFYVNAPLPFSAKILIGKTRSVKDMKNEIAVRSRVASYNTVKVPKISQYDIEYDPPFLCEEIISGRRADPLKDAAIISQRLCPQLWQTYKRQGIVLRKIQDAIETTNVLEALDNACNVVEWNGTWCDKNTFLSSAVDLVESNFFLPYSIGHGDLSLGNMVLGPDEQVYIVDWESAKEMPIVFDLSAILKQVPQSRQYIESRVEDLISENEGIPILQFRAQVFLSVVAKILQWERVREYFRRIGAPENSLQRMLFTNFDYANSFLSEPENLAWY